MILLDQLTASLGTPKHTADGIEVRFKCPFCQKRGKAPDTDWHMYINVKSGKLFCHRCNAAGTVSQLGITLDTYAGIYTFDDMKNRLDSMDYPPSTAWEPLEYPGDPMWLDSYRMTRVPLYLKYIQSAKEYLFQRGITERMLRDYNLFITGEDEFERIYFPEMDYDGNLIYWVARLFKYGCKGPKYKNAERKRSNYLYNFVNALRYSAEGITIVEGPISALMAGPDAVATYGKFVSNQQLELLVSAHARYYYVSLDGDAKDVALDLCKRLMYRGCAVKMVNIPFGEDPASLTREAYLRLKKEAPVTSDVELMKIKLKILG